MVSVDSSTDSRGRAGQEVMTEGLNLVYELTVGDTRPIVSQGGNPRTAIIGLGGTARHPESVYFVTPVVDANAGLEAWLTIVERDRVFLYDVFSPMPGGQVPFALCWLELELVRR